MVAMGCSSVWSRAQMAELTIRPCAHGSPRLVFYIDFCSKNTVWWAVEMFPILSLGPSRLRSRDYLKRCPSSPPVSVNL